MMWSPVRGRPDAARLIRRRRSFGGVGPLPVSAERRMLKQKAHAIALGVLVADLALTAASLPLTWMFRHGVLTATLPTVFPSAAVPPRPVHPSAVRDPADLGAAPVGRGLLPQPPDAAARRGDLGGGQGVLRRHRDPGPAHLRHAPRVREPLVPRPLRRGQLRLPRDREGRAAPALALGAREGLQLPHGAPRRDGAEGDAARGLPGGAFRTGGSASSDTSTTTTAARSVCRTGGPAWAGSRRWRRSSRARSWTRSSSSSRRASSASTRRRCSSRSATACGRTSRSTSSRTCWRVRSSRSWTGSRS